MVLRTRAELVKTAFPPEISHRRLDLSENLWELAPGADAGPAASVSAE